MRKNPYSEILIELEAGLWENDARVEEGAEPYEYTDEDFRCCMKVFMGALMWKMWENYELSPVEENIGKAEAMGNELRDIILKYTGIDSRKLY